jgi:anti-sigma regulatory factor (Ser/Thr protein kinase)
MKKLIQFLSSKNKSEIFLLIIVASLAIATVFYANFLANKIEKQEESQVILWAKAISEKTKVLKMSNEVFLRLAKEERKKVEITATSTQFLISENNSDKMSFLISILELNDQIPVINTDDKNKILSTKNVDDKSLKAGIYLTKNKHSEYFKFPPVEIDLLGKKQFVYYRESIIFQKISQVIKESSSQFVDEITNNSSLLPVILLDKENQVLHSGNIPIDIEKNEAKYKLFIAEIKASQKPIIIDIDPKNKKYLYYKSSNLATYIKWFPIGLYSILAMLLILTFSAIKNTRNYEKNQIWVGMSKETAHQLGTPISSLTAWLEVFEDTSTLPEAQRNVIEEMKKDVNRLTLIADRFSKIGSKPKLESIQLAEIVQTCFDYLKNRASKRVKFTLDPIDSLIHVEINRQLFEWVIENMVKNAFDAIANDGSVHIKTAVFHDKICIDVIDSGKGILPKDVERIFEPGFTTKKRGWGLGLSLCKRIIHDYFGGKIHVLQSKPNQGTTIRVELKKIN